MTFRRLLQTRRPRRNTCFIGVFAMLCVGASVSSLTATAGEMIASRSIVDAKPNSQQLSNKSLSASFMNEAFLNPDTTSHKAGYQVLGVSADTLHKGERFESGIKARGGIGLNEPTAYQYIYVPELYGSLTNSSKTTKYTLGRKILPWSEMDHQWGLGLWQPRFRWNHFLPEEQGLTGLSVDYENNDLQIIGFATPLYLPDQGPPMVLKDGSFSSPSQYFAAPASSMGLLGQNTRVRYQIDQPSITSIVFNPGAAAMIRYGGRTGFRSQLAYAYKPVNQIFLGVDGFLDLAGSDYDAIVTAHPRVVYHHLLSWEGGYYRDWTASWVGVTYERPVSDNTPAGWTIQQAAPAALVAVGTDFDVAHFSNEPTRVGASFLARNGGDASDRGPFATSGQSLFESRFQYHGAVAVSLKSPIPGILSEKLSTQTKVLYEVNNRSSALLTNLFYRVDRKWTVGVGGELLAAPAGTPSSGRHSDQISRTRANDRVYGGVTYVL